MNIEDTGQRRRLTDRVVKNDTDIELVFTLATEKVLEVGSVEAIQTVEQTIGKLRSMYREYCDYREQVFRNGDGSEDASVDGACPTPTPVDDLSTG